MTCNIKTGRKEIMHRPKSKGRKLSVFNGHFLYDSKSTKTVSSYITVEPDIVYQVTLYNMPDDAELLVHKVYLGDGHLAQGESCCDCGYEEEQPVKPILSSPLVIDGKEQKLTKNYTTMLLVIPGTYQLELTDKKYLSEFTVTLEEYPRYALNEMLGNVSLVGK